MPLARILPLLFAFAVTVRAPSAVIAADCGCHLLAEETVQARTGWRTDWTVQLPVDGSRFGVTHVVTAEDIVVAQTSDGGVHAIAAAAGPAQGTILWSRRIGRTHEAMHPATVGPTLVGVATDRNAYALRKADGKTAFGEAPRTLVEAAPSEAAGGFHVPLAGGRILRLAADPSADPAEPKEIAAIGTITSPVVPVGDDSLVWITNSGKVVGLEPFSTGWERSEIQLPSPPAGNPIVRGPIVRGNDIFVATTVGDLVRLQLRREEAGGLEPVWRMPLPGRPDGTMILDGETIFASLGLDGLVAIDVATGAIRWHRTGSAFQFRPGMGPVAAGGGRVWCIDPTGRLSLLDAATGSRVGCAPLDGFSVPVVSTVPGRLLLARPDGRIMSLSPAGG